MFKKIITEVAFRFFLLILVFTVALFTSDPAHQFLTKYLQYQLPSGFFGLTLADWTLAWTLTSLFWGGVVFGALGKKVDFVFFFLIVLFALWEYTGTENVTSQMYLGLVVVAVVGNAIGYLLKLGRERWLS